MFRKVLIANRGEVAVRVVRALRDLDIASACVYDAQDADSLHRRWADESHALDGDGPAAYLDAARLVGIARRAGCDAVHPGWGFLAENANFAQACREAGLVFIGPGEEHLALFGDKARARRLARECGVPVPAGTEGAVELDAALAFFDAQRAAGAPGVMLKALGGGGGRGLREVRSREALPAAFERCASEARALGLPGVLAERLQEGARHVEVQVAGDGEAVVALGERECTVQRRFQKLVEIAPAPSLDDALRSALAEAALRIARAVKYRSLGTFEFLVDASGAFVFIEANPRLQVEHTVTEMVTGLDLVQLQVRLAGGETLDSLGLGAPPAARGCAIQWRVNAETIDRDGNARPAGGRVSAFDMPSGPGVRVDTHGHAGAHVTTAFDSLLAKLVVHAPGGFDEALRRSRRALAECRVEGVATNLALLRSIAAHPRFVAQAIDTGWLARTLPGLVPADAGAGDDASLLAAPMAGRLVQVEVRAGDFVAAGAPLAVVEAMKMEHVLQAAAPSRVVEVCLTPGAQLREGDVILRLVPAGAAPAGEAARAAATPARIRADLQRVIDRHAFLLDANRPGAVAKRHATGGRTARENIADLCDPDSFSEYGALAIAAQSRRRSLEDLVANTPADGLVSGTATVNADEFGPEATRCVVLAYDYTVLAGTQGMRNHRKKDRMLALAHRLRLPVVLFAEGGGGRPGDVDMPIVAGLDNHTFSQFAALSGKVPVVGIVHGRCFAGNAALLGCADAIIATRASNIGMGGPAMIEGGGLGRFRPEEIGPSDVQSRNGVIDVLVEDEAHAVRVAKQYLAYFQGPLREWSCADSLRLRDAVPENRVRAYDIRAVLAGLFDIGSVLELRAGFGKGMVTALARIEGRPVGVIANDPRHLGGAIDADAADKASRFLRLCDAHGLPIVSLTDTPGFMVGPEVEEQAQVRHACRMFVAAAHLTVPFFAIVLRKGYGLGAQAMTAGGFDAPVFTVSWPTGEFGAMGLEGAVKLGFRKELEAAEPGEARDALFAELVARQYGNGQAMNMAATLEIDAVIDPAQTRAWLVRGLQPVRARAERGAGFVDPW